MIKNRKISYYFPHLFVEGKVELPVGSLTSFKEPPKELKIRHSEFYGGSIFSVNSKLEVDEFDQETDTFAQKATELLKFAYFAKNAPHGASIDGFISLETFDMFRLIENNTDKSFEHKIVISNGMSKFSHSADKVLLSRKNQAINPITVSERDFGFDIVGTYEVFESDSRVYPAIHLYNKVWEQQSLFNSFLDKPILAKTSFEVLYKINQGDKGKLKTFASDFVKDIYDFANEHKDDEVISQIITLINPYRNHIISNIQDSLNNLKLTRDSLVHDGEQNFDTSPLKFYMVWFPIYWSLTRNRKSLTRKQAVRFLCFLCLCKHLPSTWTDIEISADPSLGTKYPHLSTYNMYCNYLGKNISKEHSDNFLKVVENWLNEE